MEIRVTQTNLKSSIRRRSLSNSGCWMEFIALAPIPRHQLRVNMAYRWWMPNLMGAAANALSLIHRGCPRQDRWIGQVYVDETKLPIVLWRSIMLIASSWPAILAIGSARRRNSTPGPVLDIPAGQFRDNEGVTGNVCLFQ